MEYERTGNNVFLNIITAAQSYKIQVLRGFAISAVVLAHNTPGGLYRILLRPFFNPSVGIFLFLSGMLSNIGKLDARKRIIRMIVPYVFWTFIYTLFAERSSILRFVVTYLKGLIAGDSAAIMYYVFIYCELTLLIPVIDRLARSKYIILGLMISPIEIVFFRAVPMLLNIEFQPVLRIIINNSCIAWFTYFYLGYLVGNGLVSIRFHVKQLFLLLFAFIVIQILEGYWFFLRGIEDCGTHYKLSTVPVTCVVLLLSYHYLCSDNVVRFRAMKLLGDCSSGIFFSHLAAMLVLRKIPLYSHYAVFPINAAVTIAVSLICVLAGRKLLKQNAKYLAL